MLTRSRQFEKSLLRHLKGRRRNLRPDLWSFGQIHFGLLLSARTFVNNFIWAVRVGTFWKNSPTFSAAIFIDVFFLGFIVIHVSLESLPWTHLPTSSNLASLPAKMGRIKVAYSLPNCLKSGSQLPTPPISRIEFMGAQIASFSPQTAQVGRPDGRFSLSLTPRCPIHCLGGIHFLLLSRQVV